MIVEQSTERTHELIVGLAPPRAREAKAGASQAWPATVVQTGLDLVRHRVRRIHERNGHTAKVLERSLAGDTARDHRHACRHAFQGRETETIDRR